MVYLKMVLKLERVDGLILINSFKREKQKMDICQILNLNLHHHYNNKMIDFKFYIKIELFNQLKITAYIYERYKRNINQILLQIYLDDPADL